MSLESHITRALAYPRTDDRPILSLISPAAPEFRIAAGMCRDGRETLRSERVRGAAVAVAERLREEKLDREVLGELLKNPFDAEDDLRRFLSARSSLSQELGTFETARCAALVYRTAVCGARSAASPDVRQTPRQSLEDILQADAVRYTALLTPLIDGTLPLPASKADAWELLTKSLPDAQSVLRPQTLRDGLFYQRLVNLTAMAAAAGEVRSDLSSSAASRDIITADDNTFSLPDHAAKRLLGIPKALLVRSGFIDFTVELGDLSDAEFASFVRSDEFARRLPGSTAVRRKSDVAGKPLVPGDSFFAPVSDRLIFHSRQTGEGTFDYVRLERARMLLRALFSNDTILGTDTFSAGVRLLPKGVDITDDRSATPHRVMAASLYRSLVDANRLDAAALRLAGAALTADASRIHTGFPMLSIAAQQLHITNRQTERLSPSEAGKIAEFRSDVGNGYVKAVLRAREQVDKIVKFAETQEQLDGPSRGLFIALVDGRKANLAARRSKHDTEATPCVLEGLTAKLTNATAGSDPRLLQSSINDGMASLTALRLDQRVTIEVV